MTFDLHENNWNRLLTKDYLHTKFEVQATFISWDIVCTGFDLWWPLTSMKTNTVNLLPKGYLHTKFEVQAYVKSPNFEESCCSSDSKNSQNISMCWLSWKKHILKILAKFDEYWQIYVILKISEYAEKWYFGIFCNFEVPFLRKCTSHHHVITVT